MTDRPPDIPAPGSISVGQAEALRTFLTAALAQEGDEYIFGATASGDDPDPDTFDCAELVQWSAHRAGVELPTASYLQYLALKDKHATMSVEEALRTPGALLFRFSEEPTPGGGRPSGSHVAISLGDGDSLIEARGSKYGVGKFSAAGRGFTNAAFIPELGKELDGGGGPLLTGALGGDDPLGLGAGGAPVLGDPPPTPAPLFEFGQDTDNDGLVDSVEHYLGTDPNHPDTDLDGIPDVEEATDFGTDPLDYRSNPVTGGRGSAGSAGTGGGSAAGNLPLTSDIRAGIEAQQAAVDQAAADRAAAEAEQVHQRSLAEAAQVRLDDQARADKILEEERGLAADRHEELIDALRRPSFRFDDRQVSQLMSTRNGLSEAEVDSLALAVQRNEVDKWFTQHYEYFEKDSVFHDAAQGHLRFDQWLHGGILDGL